MKKVNIEFTENKNRPDISVVFTASEKDAQVLSLMSRVRDTLVGTITVFDGENSFVNIPEEKIISISTENKRLKVVTEENDYILNTPLKDIEKKLDDSIFLRISRFEIINLNKIRRFEFPIAGTLRIELNNGMTTWASRRCIPDIKNRFMRKGEK